MTTLIKNGTVITASDTFVADVLIENGKIQALTAQGTKKVGDGVTVIDAKGSYIPAASTANTGAARWHHASDDFDTGTVAARMAARP
ncbi:MAG: hypothetical protein WKG01_29670 [Kofleriaceae bacterium]